MTLLFAGRGFRRFGLQGYLSLFVSLFMLLAGLTSAVIGYCMILNESDSRVKDKVNDLTHIIKNEIVNRVRQPVQPTLSAMAHGVFPQCRTVEERMGFLPLMTALLENYRIISGLFIGYDNGEYFMVRRLDTAEEKSIYKAPPKSRFVVSSISHESGQTRHEHFFYDSEFRLIFQRPSELALGFDPRTRPWYREAMRLGDQVEISPIMHTSGLPVMMFAERSDDGRSVVGIDITLQDLSDVLRRELPSPGSRLALLRPDGTIIARAGSMIVENNGEPRLRTLADASSILRMAARAYMEDGRDKGFSLRHEGENWEISVKEFDFNGNIKDVMLLAIPEDDLEAGGEQLLLYAFWGMGGVFVLCMPIIWFMVRRISRPLYSIAEKAGAMHEFMSGEAGDMNSEVSEIQALTMGMRSLQGNFRKMLAITQTISSERDFGALVQLVLEETVSVVKADGGAVALLDENEKILLGEGGICWIIDGEKSTASFTSKLHESNMDLTAYKALAQNTALQTYVTREDPRSQLDHLTPRFADPEVDGIAALCVPLRDRMGEHIGVLILFRIVKIDQNACREFQKDEVLFIEALSPTVAVALENQRLIKSQVELRDALIHILAGAIDAKSPYTGGHCQRVPIIFQMLLETACAAREGPFKDFSLDEDGWRAARLAAWLHDCGKVTTPEYVVDKATKLETLYDRIHEIRTRFEVLKRDAEIARLRAALGRDLPEGERLELEKELRTLDEEFAFVAACNSGDTPMDAAVLERLAAIGRRAWLRTLDNRLGVSRAELARMDSFSGPAAPARESLLMDRPEHIIARGEKDMLDPRNPWGFKITPPQALYNRGELYNLSVRHGTLTEEERYKINDHITQTIIMLEAMPLPKPLRSVPEIAGAHHETMDGKGYPRGLKREEMSWQARMMAVADIFEALTAGDRPYKSSKTLREALEIMDKFKEQNHIDPEVYDLFVKSGIPQKYAAEYLKPEQNDL